jgi:CheY-like chemotaxis protein
LLGNAVKFTDSGGVTLEIHCQTQGIYRLDVVDTGPGIPSEAHAKIFEPFAQHESGERKGGSGLGLAISTRQIQLMGGELGLESEVGKGSRFFFTLPLPEADATEIATDVRAFQRTVTHLAPSSHVKALVVGDIAENRDVLARLLSDIGVEVSVAENGLDALEQIRASRFDIVFMDIRMPVMDGIEATKYILSEFGEGYVKLIAITSSVLTHEQEKYLFAGFDEFIPKPFRMEQICHCLANQLGCSYEYAASDSEEREAEQETDFSQITVPTDLMNLMKEAAEFYNVTDFEDCLLSLALDLS